MTSSSHPLHSNLKSHQRQLPPKLSTILLCKPCLRLQPTCQRTLHPAIRLKHCVTTATRLCRKQGWTATTPQTALPLQQTTQVKSNTCPDGSMEKKRCWYYQKHWICPVMRCSLPSCSSLASLINSKALASIAEGSKPSAAACQEQGGEVYGTEFKNTGAGNTSEPEHKNKGIQQKQALNHSYDQQIHHSRAWNRAGWRYLTPESSFFI